MDTILVAGGAGLALALMILTGLIVWIPAWRATGWRVWPRSGARRELIGSHRNLGLIFAIPLVVFSLTGFVGSVSVARFMARKDDAS